MKKIWEVEVHTRASWHGMASICKRRHFQLVLKFFANIGAFFYRSSSGFGSMPLCYKEKAGCYPTGLCKSVLNFFCGCVHDVLSVPFFFGCLNSSHSNSFSFLSIVSRDISRNVTGFLFLTDTFKHIYRHDFVHIYRNLIFFFFFL